LNAFKMTMISANLLRYRCIFLFFEKGYTFKSALLQKK